MERRIREAASKRKRKPITKDSTPEEIEAFRARAEGNQAHMKRQLAFAKMDAQERRYVRLLRKYYREASWMLTMGQFPDGGCLREQSKWERKLWTVFINAIQQAGVGAD